MNIGNRLSVIVPLLALLACGTGSAELRNSFVWKNTQSQSFREDFCKAVEAQKLRCWTNDQGGLDFAGEFGEGILYQIDGVLDYSAGDPAYRLKPVFKSNNIVGETGAQERFWASLVETLTTKYGYTIIDEAAYTESEKTLATREAELEAYELALWQKANKRDLRKLLGLKGDFKSEKAKSTADNYITSEHDRAIRNHAIKRGAPRNLLDYPICDYSGCSDWKLYDVFRLLTLANSSAVAAGMDISLKNKGSVLLLTLTISGDGARLYLGKGKDKLMIQKVTEVKGPFEKSIDGRVASYASGQLISTMGAQPDADKLDYDFINKMRK
jgi:hypothetical protein